MKWLFLLGLFSLLKDLHGKIGFKKDQSMDAIFPPRLDKPMDGIPLGHLRPLGFQKKPSQSVLEETLIPSPQEFSDKYVKERVPVVMRKAVTNVPAMTLWTDDYIKEKYGKIEIRTLVKKQGLIKNKLKRMTFTEFLDDYHYQDWYMSNICPAEMMSELVLPRCLRCGFNKLLTESELWMSSGGTSSLIHSHSEHNLHCVLSGRKDFIVIDPLYKDLIDFTENLPYYGAGKSAIDPDMVNMFATPDVKKMQWSWSTLKAGDCILIPASILHQVRSYGRSISSTILWSPVPEVNFDGCDKQDLNKNLPLSEASFVWSYYQGEEQLTNARLNAKSMKHHLLLFMREEPTLTADLFKAEYEKIMQNADQLDQNKANEVWKWLAGDGDAIEIAREKIENMDPLILEKVANSLNAPFRPHDEL